jgi:membrane-bound serine protease (ClpP class)
MGLFWLLPLGLFVQPAAAPDTPSRVEVVEVKGIIDSSVERAIVATIRGAENERADLVVLQIDSTGVLGRSRTVRLADSIQQSRVPIVSWIAPLGSRALDGAVAVFLAANVSAASPRSRIGIEHGRIRTVDLRTRGENQHVSRWDLGGRSTVMAAASIPDILERLAGATARWSDGRQTVLPEGLTEASVRFHKLDLLGRVLHGAAQPSITYLLLLLALVGIVFELFHPSTGPAGFAGLAALALALYGIVTLGGSWLGFALIVAGVALFCVDLRFSSLGIFSGLGFAGLVAGSLILFPGPWLRVSPWVLAFGIVGMVLFLLGAMTRVLRDLRAVARGELEVKEAHPE